MKHLTYILLFLTLTAQGQRFKAGVHYVPHTVSTYTITAQTSTYGLAAGETTSAIDASTANCLVVGVGAGNGSVPTISDNGSHTWTHVTACDQTSGFQVTTFFYTTGTFSSSLTVTCNGYTNIHLWAMSGVSGSPVDKTSGTIGATSNPTTTGFTPSHNGEYVFSVCTIFNNPSAPTQPTSWTANGLYSYHQFSGNEYAGGGASYLQPTSAFINPSWSYTGSTITWVCSAIAIW